MSKPIVVRPTRHDVATAAPAPAANAAPPAPTDKPMPGASAPPAVPTTTPPTTEQAQPTTPAPDAAAAAKPPEPPKLDEAEEAKRMARIRTAEGRLAQDRATFAQEKSAFAQERASHAQALEQLKTIQQAAQTARQDPIAFMRRLGVEPSVILEALIADGAKPPAARQQEIDAARDREYRARLDEIQRQLQASQEAQAQRAQAEQVSQYKTATIAPVLADKAKYELTLRALGDKAVDEVFAVQQAFYQRSQRLIQEGKLSEPVVLSPAEAADKLEANYRSQRDLLSGTSAKPAPAPQPPTRPEPPAAPTSGSPAPNPATPTSKPGAFSVAGESLDTKNSRRF